MKTTARPTNLQRVDNISIVDTPLKNRRWAGSVILSNVECRSNIIRGNLEWESVHRIPPKERKWRKGLPLGKAKLVYLSGNDVWHIA